MDTDQPVIETAATLTGRLNQYAADQLQLHRPSPAANGQMTCAESCRKGGKGAGSVQEWPCNSAQMAIAQLEWTKEIARREGR